MIIWVVALKDEAEIFGAKLVKRKLVQEKKDFQLGHYCAKWGLE